MGGVAVGKKCRACGAKSVLVQFVMATSTSAVGDRIRYDCSACDYCWFETPLYMQSVKEWSELECPMCGEKRGSCDHLMVVYHSGCGTSPPHMQWTCNQCGHTWVQSWLAPPKEPERESVASGWTLSQEIAHLEGLIEKFDRPYHGFDWEHVRLCFRNGIRRIRLLCDRQVNPYRTLYDELHMLRKFVDQLANTEQKGSTRELTKQCAHECIARIEGYTRAPLPPYPLNLLDQLESVAWVSSVGSARLIPMEGFSDPGIHQGRATIHLSLTRAVGTITNFLRKQWATE